LEGKMQEIKKIQGEEREETESIKRDGGGTSAKEKEWEG